MGGSDTGRGNEKPRCLHCVDAADLYDFEQMTYPGMGPY